MPAPVMPSILTVKTPRLEKVYERCPDAQNNATLMMHTANPLYEIPQSSSLSHSLAFFAQWQRQCHSPSSPPACMSPEYLNSSGLGR